MRKNFLRTVTSMLVATVIFSSHIITCTTVLFADENTINKNINPIPENFFLHRNFMSAERAFFVTNDNKNEVTVLVSKKNDENDDIDDENIEDALDILEMTLPQYKDELKTGQDFRSLLEEHQVTDLYDNKAYISYKEILSVALENNAITETEFTNLLDSYVKNIEKINAL